MPADQSPPRIAGAASRVVVLVLSLVVSLTACASAPSDRAVAGSAPSATATSPTPVSPPPSATPSPTRTPPQLPRGGREIFPTYRLFGYAGSPGAAAFGRLGVGNLDARVRELEKRGAAYADGRTVLPVLELVTVIAHATPGKDGDYNERVGNATINRYLAAARRHKALLLLNVQPGRARFIDVVKQLEPWLKQPDVGVALDPEWAVKKGQLPGRVYGSTTGAELDGVSAYLDALVRRFDLPQKVMVFHQVAANVVRDQAGLKERPGVVAIKSVDGIGSRKAKTATWTVLVRGLPSTIHPGFKLFFDEDARHGALMTPAQVMALRPEPEYILFE
ncbi:MAG TPA: hypothetical protein VFL94_01335 [Actinomycetales bacterium]|nr:hypothetical protein [Actinomycetales bacterium]